MGLDDIAHAVDGSVQISLFGGLDQTKVTFRQA